MTPTRRWTAGAVLTGLLAAGLSSTAAADTPVPPVGALPSSAADAVTQCLAQNGYPPLAPGSVLAPAPAAGTASPLPTAVPTGGAIPAPTAGTIPAPTAGTIPAPTVGTSPGAGTTAAPTVGTTTGAGTIPAPAAGTTPGAATTAGAGAIPGLDGLPCGKLILDNTVYLVLVTLTNTTTTTNVNAPITAAAGPISTTSYAPTTAALAPAAAGAAAAPGVAAIGKPLQVRGTAGAGSRRRARKRAGAAKAKHSVRVWLVRDQRGGARR